MMCRISYVYWAVKEPPKYFAKDQNPTNLADRTTDQKSNTISIYTLISTLPKMHEEVLTKEQIALLPLIADFSDNFGLVGGTAIALHLGHRRSIDFDLFSNVKFGNQSVLNQVLDFAKHDEIIVNRLGELTLIVKGVKLTFFHFPYKIDFPDKFGYRVKIPNLLTLAAMKAFALGHRAKWKDYVDLYFIIKDHFSVTEISAKGQEVFVGFDEKLFRSQLSYFEGINYDEVVEFQPGFETSEDTIKKSLTDISLA